MSKDPHYCPDWDMEWIDSPAELECCTCKLIEESEMKSYEHDATAAALNALAKDIFSWAEGKGFWRNSGYVSAARAWGNQSEQQMLLMQKSQKIMLVVTELAELVEGLRAGASCNFDDGVNIFTNEEEEVADAIIRLLDYAGAYRLRIGEALCAKMAKNEGRPFRHGKEF